MKKLFKKLEIKKFLQILLKIQKLSLLLFIFLNKNIMAQTYSIPGSWNGWNTNRNILIDMGLIGDGNSRIWECTTNMGAVGDYQYKHFTSPHPSWTGWSGRNGVSKYPPQYFGPLTNTGGNITITNKGGDYVFQFRESDWWMCVKQKTVQISGNFNGWATTTNMAYCGTANLYGYHKYFSKATNIEFKFIMGQTWYMYSWGQNGTNWQTAPVTNVDTYKHYNSQNIRVKIPYAGVWHFYFDFGTGKYSVKQDLMISYVHGRAGNSAGKDCIEIYNPTPSSINLNGKRVVKRTSAATNDTLVYNFTTDRFVPAYGYFLLARSNNSYMTNPDIIDAGVSIAEDNSIGIRYGANDTGYLIDCVSFGNPSGTPLREGSSGAGSIDQTNGRKRKIGIIGHHQDTDNNANDFELGSASPGERPGRRAYNSTKLNLYHKFNTTEPSGHYMRETTNPYNPRVPRRRNTDWVTNWLRWDRQVNLTYATMFYKATNLTTWNAVPSSGYVDSGTYRYYKFVYQQPNTADYDKGKRVGYFFKAFYDSVLRTNITYCFSMNGDDPQTTPNPNLAFTNNFKYTIANSPPVVTNLITPNNVTNYYSRRPKFIWSPAIDPDGDSLQSPYYHIWIADNSNFTSPIVDTDTGSPNNWYQYTGAMLDLNKWYYWRVTAYDGENWGPYSKTGKFKINPPFITVDGIETEWGPANFATGSNFCKISNGQYMWKDPKYPGGDSDGTDVREISGWDWGNCDISEFRVTADTNVLFFKLNFLNLTSGSLAYLCIAIDTDKISNSGGTYIAGNSATVVNPKANWEKQIVCTLDKTGFYDTSWNWTECGESWWSDSNDLVEIGIPWSDLGISLPTTLRFTVAVGYKDTTDQMKDPGGGVSRVLDCISRFGPNTWDEVNDGNIWHYFDVDFGRHPAGPGGRGIVIVNHFRLAPNTTTVKAGVPFALTNTAHAFNCGCKACQAGPGGSIIRDYGTYQYSGPVAYSITPNHGDLLKAATTGFTNGRLVTYPILNQVTNTVLKVYDSNYTTKTGIVTLIGTRPKIYINEIMYNPAGSDDNNEWFEIYNKDSSSVNLTNWTFFDEEGTFPKATITKNVVMPSNSYLIWRDGSGTDDTDFSDGRGLIWSEWGSGILDSIDAVSIYCSPKNINRRNTLIDFVFWGGNPGTRDDIAVSAGIWTNDTYAYSVPEGMSLMLWPDGNDNNSRNDWARNYVTTNIGFQNPASFADTGIGYKRSRMLVMRFTLPDKQRPANDTLQSIAFKNAGTATASDITNVRVWFDDGNRRFTSSYQFGGSGVDTNIGGQAMWNGTSWTLGGLSQTIGSNGLEIFVSADVKDTYTAGRTIKFVIPKGYIKMASGSWPDRAITNISTQTLKAGWIVLNEIMYRTGDGLNEPLWEYIELYNNSNTPINVSNWRTHTATSSDPGIVSWPGNPWGYPASTIIPPGRCAVIFGRDNPNLPQRYDVPSTATILRTGDNDGIGSGLPNSGTSNVALTVGNTIIAFYAYRLSPVLSKISWEKIDPGGYDIHANWQLTSATKREIPPGSGFTNSGTCGYLNGFRAFECTNYSAIETVISLSNKVMDFKIPDNNGAADTLNEITLKQHPTATATTNDIILKLWRDANGNGILDAGDTFVGTFTPVSNQLWRLSGISASISAGGTRFLVYANKKPTAIDRRTVRLYITQQDLPVGPYTTPPYLFFNYGAAVASFNSGPVDAGVTNTYYQFVGKFPDVCFVNDDVMDVVTSKTSLAGLDTRTRYEAQFLRTPWRTIQKAITNMSNPGDKIYVVNGIYNENLNISKYSGTSASNILISNCTVTNINFGTNVLVRANISGPIVNINSVSNIIFRGFRVGRSGGNGGGINITNSRKITIATNRVYSHTSFGIFLNNSQNCFLTNNIVISNTNIGIRIYGVGGNHIIRKNTSAYNNNGLYIQNATNIFVQANQIYQNSTNQIRIEGASVSNIQIYNNTIFSTNDNGDKVLLNQNKKSVYVRNNTIYGGNKKAGIKLNLAKNAVISHNNIYSNWFGVYVEYSTNNFIWTNLVYKNAKEGIYILNLSMSNTIKSNTVYSNGLASGSGGIGIYLYGDYVKFNNVCSNHLFDNDLSANKDNIKIEAPRNNVYKNKIHSGLNGKGIILITPICYSNNIYRNTLYSNNYGIWVQDSKLNNITENTLYKNKVDSYSVFVGNSTNNYISRNYFYTNYGSGIQIDYNSISNKIYTNTFIRMAQRGIQLLGDYNILKGNRMFHCAYQAIPVEYSAEYNIIRDNIIGTNGSGNTIWEAGILIVSGAYSNRIINNQCFSNHPYGISLINSAGWAAKNNIIQSNTCYNNDNFGIRIHGATNNFVYDNVLRNNRYGIYIEANSSRNIIKNNIAKNNSIDGIYLNNSPANIIKNNTALTNTSNNGITFDNSANNNYCASNISAYNAFGIRINNTSGVTLYRNAVYHNNGHGIWLTDGDNNYIYHNSVASNDQYGNYDNLRIDANSTGNTVINNIFAYAKLSPGYGVYIESGGSANLKYNNSYGNASGNYGGTASAGSGSISQNPLWLSYDIYSTNFLFLSDNSPCIDVGTNLGFPYIGNAPDMGWKEFNKPFVKLFISKTNESITLGGSPTNAIPGAMITYKITYSIVTNLVQATNIIITDKLQNWVTYHTDYLGTAVGWTVEYSTNTNPDQSYNSPHYSTTRPAKNLIKWVRWKKNPSGADNNKTLYLKVIIK